MARQAITIFLQKEKEVAPPADTPAKLKEKCGVFVTLNKKVGNKEELRGCIGYPFSDLPLVEATIDAAISSAVGDTRFSRVESKELKDITVEVSVLTPPKLIKVVDAKEYVNEVKIGEDGLIVERGWCKGLLLPQVPVEWRWDCEEFLSNCCMKAGLPPDAWLIDGTKIYKFSCIIAKETSPNGPVKVIDMRKGEEYK